MKEGGLLSLPELQLVVPPRCALQDHASPAVPTTPLLPLLPLEAIHITHPSACNAAVLSASVEQCVCVLVHSRGRGRAA